MIEEIYHKCIQRCQGVSKLIEFVSLLLLSQNVNDIIAMPGSGLCSVTELTSLHRSLCAVVWGLLHISGFSLKARFAGRACLLRIVLHRTTRIVHRKTAEPESLVRFLIDTTEPPKLLIHNSTVSRRHSKYRKALPLTVHHSKSAKET